MEGSGLNTHILSATPFGNHCFQNASTALARAPPLNRGWKAAEIQSSLAFFTCSRCQPWPYSAWRSTSSGGCFSGLYGTRRAAMMTTEVLKSRPLSEGILAGAFPTQSRIQGSLSSHRVWLLACISLQAKKTTVSSFKYIRAAFLESLTLDKLLILNLLNSEHDSEFPFLSW